MIDTALKCLELLKAIAELREQVADNVAHYHRLCSRALAFESMLKAHSTQSSVQPPDHVQDSLDKLREVLGEIKQLADRFPKKTLAGFVKHCIFRNHYADEVHSLNAQLTECAIDLQVMQLESLRAQSQEDQEDLCRFLSSSVDRVVQEIRVRNELAAGEQLKEVIRQATEEDFAYLKADLRRCMEEISVGLMDQQLAPAVQAEGKRLMMQVDGQHADMMGVLQQVHAGQRAMHEDVRALCAQMEALQQVVQEATEDGQLAKAASRPEKQMAKLEILRRLDRSSGGTLQVVERCLLGEGSFGKVFLGLLNDTSEVAVKRVASSEFEAEVLVMDIVKGHPKILSCYGFVRGEDCCHILLELMPFGSLSSLLYDKKNFKLLPSSLLLAWGCDMADALCHIHSLKVKHRDLKAENCLVSADLQLKLCDFGTAKRQETTLRNAGNSATVVGTLAFMAPEVLGKKGSDFSADIFSWAVAMVQILMRAAPSNDTATADLVKTALSHLQQTSSAIVANALRDLLHSCVYYDEKVLNSHWQRPSAAEVFRRMTQLLRESGGDPRSSHACKDVMTVEFVKTMRATAAGLWEKKQQKGRASGSEVLGPQSETLRVHCSARNQVGGIGSGATLSTKPLEELTAQECALLVRSWGCTELLPCFEPGGALFGGGLLLSYLSGPDDVKEVAPSIPLFKARLLVDKVAQCNRKGGVDMALLEQFKQVSEKTQETKSAKMPPSTANSTSPTSPKSTNGATTVLPSNSLAATTVNVVSSAKFKAGEAVEANFKSLGMWYPGKISKLDVVDSKLVYHVLYDDGDLEKKFAEKDVRLRPLPEVSPAARSTTAPTAAPPAISPIAFSGSVLTSAKFAVGDFVEADHVGVGRWRSGKVIQSAVRDGQGVHSVLYDEGDKAFDVAERFIRQEDASKLCSVGLELYNARDYGSAFKLWTKASAMGHARAQCNLGLCYEEGHGVSQDWEQAVHWYQKAADQGDADAQCNLGLCYGEGQGVSQDWEQAVHWFRKAADQGNALAQFNLGICYEKGQGVSQDWEQAVRWYGKAADQGDADAQYSLGLCYANGQGVSQDWEQAVHWYRKAADQGIATAQLNLGICYEKGQGVSHDWEQAVRWYRKAADQGNALAQLYLGLRYSNGQGVSHDWEQAVHWFRKAADQGNALAQFNLGICYENGQGVSQDWEQAVHWYRKAADQGYVRAQYCLGRCHQEGQGVSEDWEQAVHWYRKAADQGHVTAQCNLGRCHQEGQGVSEDWEQAVHWYGKAADQGHAAAQCILGLCYEMRQGVSKDWEQAVHWYRKAADQGLADAQLYLGLRYSNGQGVSQDWEQAVHWFRKAADQGNALAQFSLGICYEKGQGVSQDWEQAVHWYRKAADQGHVTAQFYLGLLLESGEGVCKDEAQAKLWYGKAAAQGNEEAKVALKGIEDKISSKK